MAKVDDYQQSFDLAADEILAGEFSQVAQNAGADLATDGSYLELKYYGRPVRVTAGEITVSAQDEGPELPLAEQALVLHYLARAKGHEPTGEWITFREVPSGEFYWSAFVKRAKDPLVGFFGSRPELLEELAPLVGGEPALDTAGDVAMRVWAFPKVPLLLQIYAGDEEFPAEGNVLFDRTVDKYLSTEDCALTAGLPIYKMMALARSRG